MRSDDWMMRSRDWLTWSSDWMCALRDQHMRSLCRTFARRFCVALSLQRIRLATLAGGAMSDWGIVWGQVSAGLLLLPDNRLQTFYFSSDRKERGGGVFWEKKLFCLMKCFCLTTTIPVAFFDSGLQNHTTILETYYPHPTFTGKLQNGSHPTHTTIYFFLVFFCFGVSPHIAV